MTVQTVWHQGLKNVHSSWNALTGSAILMNVGSSARYLPRQVSLKHLHMRCFPHARSVIWKDPIVESDTCPHLVSLEGTWNTIKPMLPHRKIEKLVVTYDLGYISENNDTHSLTPTLQHVQVLHYSFPTPNPPAPDPLLLNCTSLKILVLVYSAKFEEEGLSAVLSKMASLHTLILSTNRSGILVGEARQLSLRIFQKYNINIRCIYVQFNEEVYVLIQVCWGGFCTDNGERK